MVTVKTDNTVGDINITVQPQRVSTAWADLFKDVSDMAMKQYTGIKVEEAERRGMEEQMANPEKGVMDAGYVGDTEVFNNAVTQAYEKGARYAFGQKKKSELDTWLAETGLELSQNPNRAEAQKAVEAFKATYFDGVPSFLRPQLEMEFNDAATRLNVKIGGLEIEKTRAEQKDVLLNGLAEAQRQRQILIEQYGLDPENEEGRAALEENMATIQGLGAQLRDANFWNQGEYNDFMRREANEARSYDIIAGFKPFLEPGQNPQDYYDGILARTDMTSDEKIGVINKLEAMRRAHEQNGRRNNRNSAAALEGLGRQFEETGVFDEEKANEILDLFTTDPQVREIKELELRIRAHAGSMRIKFQTMPYDQLMAYDAGEKPDITKATTPEELATVQRQQMEWEQTRKELERRRSQIRNDPVGALMDNKLVEYETPTEFLNNAVEVLALQEHQGYDKAGPLRILPDRQVQDLAERFKGMPPADAVQEVSGLLGELRKAATGEAGLKLKEILLDQLERAGVDDEIISAMAYDNIDIAATVGDLLTRKEEITTNWNTQRGERARVENRQAADTVTELLNPLFETLNPNMTAAQYTAATTGITQQAILLTKDIMVKNPNLTVQDAAKRATEFLMGDYIIGGDIRVSRAAIIEAIPERDRNGAGIQKYGEYVLTAAEDIELFIGDMVWEGYSAEQREDLIAGATVVNSDSGTDFFVVDINGKPILGKDEQPIRLSQKTLMEAGKTATEAGLTEIPANTTFDPIIMGGGALGAAGAISRVISDTLELDNREARAAAQQARRDAYKNVTVTNSTQMGWEEMYSSSNPDFSWDSRINRQREEDLLRRASFTMGEDMKPTGNEVVDLIQSASEQFGIPLEYLIPVAQQESAMGTNNVARTSSARGVFQFIDSTWREMVRRYGAQYGLTINGRLDKKQNVIAGALFALENKNSLERRLGREPTPTELYFAHFMGAGRAGTFLSAPRDTLAINHVPRSYVEANRSIFYAGDTPRTVQQVVNLFNRKIEGKFPALAAQYGLVETRDA